MKRNAEAGKQNGKCPYDFTKDSERKLLPHDGAVDVVKHIFNLYGIERMGSGELTFTLNSQRLGWEYKEKPDAPWSKTTIIRRKMHGLLLRMFIHR